MRSSVVRSRAENPPRIALLFVGEGVKLWSRACAWRSPIPSRHRRLPRELTGKFPYFPLSPTQVRILEAALRKKFDLDRRLRVWSRPGVKIDREDSIDLAKVSKEVPGKSPTEVTVTILKRVSWWLVFLLHDGSR